MFRPPVPPSLYTMLQVWRQGKELNVEVPLEKITPLAPMHLYEELPSYFIYAGLLFVPLTVPYLREFNEH